MHWYRSAVEHPVCAFASLKKNQQKKMKAWLNPGVATSWILSTACLAAAFSMGHNDSATLLFPC